MLDSLPVRLGSVAIAGLSLALSFATTPAQSGQPPFRIATHRATLANGMRVIVAPIHTTPLVAVRLFYDVGSRHEHTGITGMAHLLEHMMFNGTARYGPKQFDAQLEAAGGHGNAFTTRDLTCYTTQVPPSSLDQVLELEADRMTGLSIDAKVLANELQIVREERRQNLGDNPQASGLALLFSTHFRAHPYRWPVLGWISDVMAFEQPQVMDFYRRFYAPNRAVLVLAGDVRIKPTMAKVRAAFGSMPRAPTQLEPTTTEPVRRHSGRATLTRQRAAPTLWVGFTGPEAKDDDFAAASLLQAILTGGASSRLQRRLVRDEQLATTIFTRHSASAAPELLSFEFGLSLGQGPDDVEDALFEELDKIAKTGVQPDELAAAKAAERANLIRSMTTLGSTATALGQFEVLLGDCNALFELGQKVQSTTPAQVQAAAQRFFRREQATVVWLRTKEEDK